MEGKHKGNVNFVLTPGYLLLLEKNLIVVLYMWSLKAWNFTNLSLWNSRLQCFVLMRCVYFIAPITKISQIAIHIQIVMDINISRETIWQCNLQYNMCTHWYRWANCEAFWYMILLHSAIECQTYICIQAINNSFLAKQVGTAALAKTVLHSKYHAIRQDIFF